MKLTKKELKSLIESLVHEELNEISMLQAKMEKPIKDFVASVNAAKESLGQAGAQRALLDMMQHAQDPRTAESIERLLQSTKSASVMLDKILEHLNKMPHVTGNPWHAVRRDS